MNKTELKKAYDKSKIGIMIKGSVFLSTILFSLKQDFTSKIATAGTDGVNLLINPEWFMELTEEQRVGLLAHEIWHVAYEHMDRRKDHNPQRWNIAGDHLINIMLVNANFEIPPNGCCDFAFRNMSTQQIYDALPEESEMYEDFDCDLIEGNSKEDQKEKEAIRVNIIIKAITQSKLAKEKVGTIPEEIARKIQELINPVLPWNDLLQRFLTARSNADYTWQRPKRRFIPDYHLPSAYSESLDNIAIAIDTSGSVTDEQFTEFLSEISYIHETMKPTLMTIIDFDTTIKKIHKIHEGDSITEVSFTGYGGTKIEEVLDWGVTNNPTALLIFTDGYFSQYTPDIAYPVMWIIHGNKDFNYPIGEVVHYD